MVFSKMGLEMNDIERRRRWWRMALLGSAAVVFPALATGQQPGGAESETTSVEAAVVREEVADETLRVVGSVIADESVTLRPEVAGRIASIAFDEGQAVTAGQVMFTLDPAEAEAQVASSEAATKLWQLKFDRARDLLNRSVMSQQEYDETQATLKESRARLELERVRLQKTVIRTPTAGVAGLRQVSVGDYVEIGDELVTVDATDPVKLDFSIPEQHIARIGVGQSLMVSVQAYPGRTFTGTVYAVDPRLDVSQRSLRARGRIANPDGALRPGMFAQVDVVITRREQALWVPEEAIVPRSGEQFVFRIDDGRAMLTPVRLGVRRVGSVEILEGLKSGDTVVTAGHTMLRDQSPVRVVDLPAPRVPGV
jgi:membrane fusion protein (multidrug efflux system)